MLGPLGSPTTISAVPRRALRAAPLDAREFTPRHVRRWADLTAGADTSDFGMDLAFAVTDSGRDAGDRSAGIAAGPWARVECIGAVLSDRGEVALTREQVVELIGADRVAEAERWAAGEYADGMEE